MSGGEEERPATYEELQAGYEDMRDHCRAAFDGWTAERRNLWAAEAAIREALNWLNLDDHTGTGYANRITYARNALKRIAAYTPTPNPQRAKNAGGQG